MTALEQLRQQGIRRRGSPKRGFRYVLPNGRPAPKAAVERINALRLPPAWTDVHIAPGAKAKLQAVGRDKAGRWQYRYHPDFRSRQDQAKYQRLLRFAQSIPEMRRAVARDLARPGLGREKVMAAALRVLSTCFVRPGSAVYAEENGSFGLATLRHKHVKVRGDTIVLDFPGKSGKQQHRELKDRRVARLMRKLLQLPGKEVLKYIDTDGRVVDVRRRDINAYIKEVMGEHFTAKDFRTWAGTLICACALARAGVDGGEAMHARKKKVVRAVKEAAEHLGNTPAICRSSYIFPSVLSHFERGRVLDRYFDEVEELVLHDRPDFHASERALLKLLKQKAA